MDGLPISQWLGADKHIPLGTVYLQSGWRYECVGYELYQNRNDETIALVRWSARCAQCGVPFIAKSKPDPRWLSARCAEHKRPGVRVKSRYHA